MTVKVYTPVEDYTGAVAGVEFVGGVGETDNPGALAYFRRHGYRIEAPAVEEPKPKVGRPGKRDADKETEE